jgi:hypothetical protein
MPRNLNQIYIHEFGFWVAGGKEEPSAQLYSLYSLYCCRRIEGMVVEATSMQTTCVKRCPLLNCTLCTVCTVVGVLRAWWWRRPLCRPPGYRGVLSSTVHFVQYVLLQVYRGHGGGGDLYADHLGTEESSAQLYTLYNMYCCRCIEGMVVEATSMQTTCGADGKWSHPLPKERSSPTQSFLGRS